MLNHIKTTALVMLVTGAWLVPSMPANALTAELAKKCRDMAIQAHPTQAYGAGGSAAQQRDYFSTCVARNGDMQDQTTGSGSSEAH